MFHQQQARMCCGEALRGRVAWAHDWISDPSLTPLFQTLLELDRQRRHTGAERRAGRSRRGASARHGVTLLAKFDGEFASHSSSYGGSGTFRYRW
jgi:hypothetical protein